MQKAATLQEIAMTFRIKPLDPEPFRHLFGLPDDELARQGVRRVVADEKPGFPCRVSLEDAPLGASMLLLNHEYMALPSPYRARHAIYIREGAEPVEPEPDEIPDVIADRLIAVRAYDNGGWMLDAEIDEGTRIAPIIERMFGSPDTAFIQLHNARRGCFAANVERA
jgi:Protein of unknown function (DUF1203)